MSTTSHSYAVATLEMTKMAMKAAIPTIRQTDADCLSEEKLQILYTLR